MGHSKIQTTFDTYGHLLPGLTTRCASGWTPTCGGPAEEAIEAAEDAA